MTVQELIDNLQVIQDKSLQVYVYVNDKPCEISMVDDYISDRIDINIKE